MSAAGSNEGMLAGVVKKSAGSARRSLGTVQPDANDDNCLVDNNRLSDIATSKQEKAKCTSKESCILTTDVTKPSRTLQLVPRSNSREATLPTAAHSQCMVADSPDATNLKAAVEALTLKRDQLSIEHDMLHYENMELKNKVEDTEKFLEEKRALHPQLEALMDRTLNLVNKVKTVKHVLDQP